MWRAGRIGNGIWSKSLLVHVRARVHARVCDRMFACVRVCVRMRAHAHARVHAQPGAIVCERLCT